MTVRRMRIACSVPKTTNTHSKYVILIAFPRQKWLQERASMLRYAYIVCLVIGLLYINTVIPRLTSDPANEFFG